MQALKNLFTKKATQQTPQIQSTFDHSKISSNQDISQCPFMKNKQQSQQIPVNQPKKQQDGKCPYDNTKGKKQSQSKTKQQGQSSQSEQQIPRGGCPFMGGSQKKRNPDLYQQPSLGYDQPFVSKFHYYLSANKIDMTMLSSKSTKKVQPISRSREIFNTYPIYLQHSLFFNGQDYIKVRGIECCSRFMPYDKLREKGNKYFNKGKFVQALEYYQRALSLFKWLEYYEQGDDNNSDKRSQSFNQKSLSQLPSHSLSSLTSTQSLPNNNSYSNSPNIHLNLNSQKQLQSQQQQQTKQIFQKDTQLQQMKTKYKQFFVIYTDGNVRVCDGQQMQDAPDVDMRRSLMLQVLLNMAMAYSKLGNFTVALQCVEDCMKLSDKVSQVYLRKAQVLIFNKGCSLQQALEAKQCMQKALQLKQSEKIFQSNQNMLRMVNLHNAQQSYQKTLDFVNDRITEISSSVGKLTQRIYQRAKEINQVQKRLIEQGKTPYQRHEQEMEKSKQFKILLRMRQKYIKVIEFYAEAQNKEQVELAKVQLQQLLRVFAQMSTITGIKLEQRQNQLGGIQQEKIQRRIQTIKKNYCEEIYNSARFNFTVMEWAIKEIVKQQRQQEEYKRKEQERERVQRGEVVVEEGKQGKNGLIRLATWGMVVVPVVGILVNQFLMV